MKTYNDNIIDTHMHLWDLANKYPWLETNDPTLEHLGGNYDQLKANFLVPDYIKLTQHHKIEKSVHLEAFGFAGSPVAETEWLQTQADKQGFPHAIIAHADLHLPNVENILQQHSQHANVRGIRMALNYHEQPNLRMTDRGDYMQDAAWLHGFALLEKYNLSFDLQIYDHQIDDAITLAKQFPNTVIILEHFAWPLDLSPQGFAVWQQRLKRIAACPNVMLKLSGIGWVFQRLAQQQIQAYFSVAIDVFGFDRCMFGSNFPADKLFYTFDNLIQAYKSVFANYALDEQHKYFYATAKRVYRL
jgi:predicted TIM-barrel fold metal-dependent hydrolase